MNEHQVREHVRKLRRFYSDALIYGVVNLGLILIWAISGGGYFWPIWVIIGWGIGLGIHAFSLGLIPQMNAMVLFMTAEWEDQEVKRLMQSGSKNKEEKKADHKESENPKESPIAKKKAPPSQKKISVKASKESKA